MDVQDNAPASAAENIDTLSLISDLRADHGEAAAEPTPQPETSLPQVADAPAASEPAVEAPDEAAEARRNALLREIAIDPALTNQYLQQQFAPAHQPQQQAPVVQPQQQPAALPFDEFTYDSNNPEHQKALIAHQLHELGGPMFEAVSQMAQRQQQQDQAQQQQQQQAMAAQANKKTTEFMDTYTPGFSKITEKLTNKEPLTGVEDAVFRKAADHEAAWLDAYAADIAQKYQTDFGTARSYAVGNVQIRADIAQKIGPEIQKYAKELGLVSQPAPTLTPEAKKVMKQEAYVESSNAVPASSASKFESAHKSGDTVYMIGAIRAQR